MNFEKLRQIMEPNVDTRASRAFDLVMQAIIVFAIICFTVETLPDLSKPVQTLFRQVEIVVVAIFSVEYVLRIVSSDRKWKFVFSFFGLIDLLAILPFYIGLGIDLRALRILRLFRLFRALKLLRYNRALKHLSSAFTEVKEELILYLIATSLMIYLASAGIYHFENEAQPEEFKSIFHSMWWSVVTLTTVGYGDVYPVTLGGRIFTAVLILIGVSVIAVPSGLIASGLTKTQESKSDQ